LCGNVHHIIQKVVSSTGGFAKWYRQDFDGGRDVDPKVAHGCGDADVRRSSFL
jgi:hypothetical protein